MHIIEKTFKDLHASDKVAFIPFIVAGHPNMSKTEELIYLLQEEGANIIEVGIPFSDPLADGPVIEKTAQKSILGGTTISKVFECITKVRKKTDIPIVFLVYFNSILAFGISNFIERCVEAKVDGLIIPDLPFEERDELLPFLIETDIALIPLVTPTSDDRIEKIVRGSRGFVYCVSSLGVTGVRSDFNSNIATFIENIRKYTTLPLALGFGISGPNDIKDFMTLVDGIIVGSALVKEFEETNYNLENTRKYLKHLTAPLI